MRSAVRIVAGAMAACATLAAADTPPNDIVVNGQTPLTRKDIRHLTQSISPSTQDQMARMGEGYCPAVFGMPDPYAGILAARMARDAAEFGAPAAKPGCRPNALVIFTEDGHALIDGLRKDSPYLFGSLDAHAIRKLAESAGPAYFWANTSIRDEDGAYVSGARFGDFMARKIPTAHIMDLSSIQNIDWSVVVIQQSAAIGKTLTQLADYAAMRTLTQAELPASAKPGDTILGLFHAPAAPAELTTFDKGYAAGLYAGRANMTYVAKVGAIAHAIDRGAGTNTMAQPGDNGASAPPGASGH